MDYAYALATILLSNQNSANIRTMDKLKDLVCPYASWNNKLPGVGRNPLFLLFAAVSQHKLMATTPAKSVTTYL
jgi:hypothetical protein